ncbi:unnamed protein product [Lota lota]
METDSAAGDVDSVHGGLSSVDPLVERILEDTVCQQQGWLRVYESEGRGLRAVCRDVTHTQKEKEEAQGRVGGEPGGAAALWGPHRFKRMKGACRDPQEPGQVEPRVGSGPTGGSLVTGFVRPAKGFEVPLCAPTSAVKADWTALEEACAFVRLPTSSQEEHNQLSSSFVSDLSNERNSPS